MNDIENESTVSRTGLWRERLLSLLSKVLHAARRVAPFAAGVAAAFAALLLYRAAFPPPRSLTAKDVNGLAAAVMASATPPPA